jgi:hypothetical protein
LHRWHVRFDARRMSVRNAPARERARTTAVNFQSPFAAASQSALSASPGRS